MWPYSSRFWEEQKARTWTQRLALKPQPSKKGAWKREKKKMMDVIISSYGIFLWWPCPDLGNDEWTGKTPEQSSKLSYLGSTQSMGYRKLKVFQLKKTGLKD